MDMQALRAAELERAKRDGREADGLVFRTTERRDDYLRRKANAEKSGRYANLVEAPTPKFLNEAYVRSFAA